jgi:hypothetical protein
MVIDVRCSKSCLYYKEKKRREKGVVGGRDRLMHAGTVRSAHDVREKGQKKNLPNVDRFPNQGGPEVRLLLRPLREGQSSLRSASGCGSGLQQVCPPVRS